MLFSIIFYVLTAALACIWLYLKTEITPCPKWWQWVIMFPFAPFIIMMVLL